MRTVDEVRNASECEVLKVSKVSPLDATKRTTLKGVSTSPMGHFRTHGEK
ncbi:hypothetical protein ABIA45_001770 [Bradyrhizobium sp. USDA 336]